MAEHNRASCACTTTPLRMTKKAAPPTDPMTPQPLSLPSTRQLAVAVARLIKLAQANSLRAKGTPAAEALRAVRLSAPTEWRWARRFSRAGLDGLIDGRRRAGRKPRQTTRTEAIAP